MRAMSTFAFAASGLLLLAFVINLILGKGGAAPAGTVSEMLLLFAASACFGAGTLIREALAGHPG